MANLGSAQPAAVGPANKLGEVGRHFEEAVKRLYTCTSRLQSANDRIAGSLPPSPIKESAVPTPAHAIGFLETVETDLRHALAFLEQEVSRVEEL